MPTIFIKMTSISN